MKWSRRSYRDCIQQIQPFDFAHPVFDKIYQFPPIVPISSIQSLRKQLLAVQRKQNFLLQIGDCAQDFQQFSENYIHSQLTMFQRVANLIEKQLKKKTIIIGRIAGQYAKPRSKQTVSIGKEQIYNYMGDMVNSFNPDKQERIPDPIRIIQGYFYSIASYNYIKNTSPSTYISHQGLILPYEEAMIRQYEGKYYGCSAHMLWIGQRTRGVNNAHVQFFRGLQNPIGVKVSDKIERDQFSQLCRKLNPLNQQGKLLVIIRMGMNINKLRDLLEQKQKNKLKCILMSDPMHGNTFQSKVTMKKHRNLQQIGRQLQSFKKLVVDMEGLHLQATSSNVQQCINDITQLQGLRQDKYLSKCDPRLNQKQIPGLINLL